MASMPKYERDFLMQCTKLARSGRHGHADPGSVLEAIKGYHRVSRPVIDRALAIIAFERRAASGQVLNSDFGSMSRFEAAFMFRLRWLVERLGGAQKVARMIGRRKSNGVSMWLNQSRLPSIKQVELLTKAAGKPPEWLYAGDVAGGTRLWDRHEIKAELARRGTSPTRLCRRPGPKRDRLVSEVLAVPLFELWPDRYAPDGSRITSMPDAG